MEANDIYDLLKKEGEKPLRIALVGQPGAGKSSLINAITGQKLAEVSQRTDTTVEATAYRWEGLELWDLPGYGTTKFPPGSFIDRFDVNGFDVYLCVFSGKLTSADDGMFVDTVRKGGKPFIFVRTKADTIWEEGKSYEELKTIVRNDVLVRNQAGNASVVFTSVRPTPEWKETIGELQDEIRELLGPAEKARFDYAAAAMTVVALNRKCEIARRKVTQFAGAALANGFNPIPGANVAVDVGLILACFQSIRNSFSITEEDMNDPSYVALMGPMLRGLGAALGPEVIIKYLSQIAGRVAVQNFAKYIPFVGQAVAGTIGFAIVKTAGNNYVDDCYKIAEAKLLKSVKALR